MIEVAVFGAGRIGKIHAENVARHPKARLRYVVDPDLEAAGPVAEALGAEATRDAEVALADSGVLAVVVASPTPTHVDLVVAAARAHKAILCEKPIDLDLARIDAALDVVDEHQVPFMVGFNRRFDPSFARLKGALAREEIGRVELVTITSRDPRPPSAEYLARSGGLFRDMMIHDLDMARWLLGEEPVQVYASARALVDPAAAELGDVDTAAVVLTTASGTMATITNSRRAVYGYDQRVEVHGSDGMLQAKNHESSSVVRWTAQGVLHATPPDFFLERYAEAYAAELDHFLTAVVTDESPCLVGPHDGRQALVLAEAAARSVATGAVVRVEGFERGRGPGPGRDRGPTRGY